MTWRIMVNSGHDGQIGSNGLPVDSGAVNVKYQAQECDIALAISQKVVDYLKSAGGYSCHLMMSDNLCGEGSYSYTYSVVGQANINRVDLFLSIHTNSFWQEGANGTECLVYQFGSKAEELAECIQKRIVDNLGTTDRGVRQRPDLAVLRCTHMPAVLIETAFISNENDVKLLIDKEKQKEFARAIALGVTDYVAMQEGK